ncbi:unnamed protein product [Diatraea saccharalis]|uniref:Uncharacterized protein n=1 Tax=Diatraea saccharalis TaxID=40085 RepID=A0A9N9QX59_9NEOP|nr:unnamed protein product [Diatraea saccharalis]
MSRHTLRVPEVRVSGAPAQDDQEDSPAALPPFALTLASIPRRRHSWICGGIVQCVDKTNVLEMLPIAEAEEGATAQVSVGRHRRTRDRVVTAEMRAVRRRRGWTVVGSETR